MCWSWLIHLLSRQIVRSTASQLTSLKSSMEETANVTNNVLIPPFRRVMFTSMPLERTHWGESNVT